MTAESPAVDVTVIPGTSDELGEGPVWHAESGSLSRIDVVGRSVIVRDVATGTERCRVFDGPVGFAIPRGSGGFVIGVGRDIVLLNDLDAPAALLTAVEPNRPDNRFNDAICDSRGRLWAGTYGRGRPGGAALHLVVAGEETQVAVPDVSTSNGLDWSSDGAHLYYVDTATQRIDLLDVDLDTGCLHDRRTFAVIDADDGAPDGLCVDADGGVWLALYGGGAIRRYLPDGTLDLHIPVPVTNPSSLAFGGPNLDDLYVTSSKVGLTRDQLEQEPQAGSLLSLTPGMRGRLPHLFAG